MKRREFILGLGIAAALPKAARAQQPARMQRIGVLMPFVDENDPEGQARIAIFREGLLQRGWKENDNIRIDIRWGALDAQSSEPGAKELVALQPDLILSTNTPTTAAIRQQTRTIPIVFVNVADPLGPGFVASISRPGGNITGFTNTQASLGGKWVELLKQIAPRVSRVAYLFNPATAPGGGSYFMDSFKTATAHFALDTIEAPLNDRSEFESVFAALAREPNTGLVVIPDAFTGVYRADVTSRAARYRLPAVYPFRYFTEIGGLLSYGSNQRDNFRLAVIYIDRILRGDKPVDLPVHLPIKFELTINLKTAKALGLTIPETLLATADEVIE
jgi:putative tryptophan/tyrosine transport system substrate-binding protein